MELLTGNRRAGGPSGLPAGKGKTMENFIAWAINNPMEFAIPFSAFSLVVILILFYILTFTD